MLAHRAPGRVLGRHHRDDQQPGGLRHQLHQLARSSRSRSPSDPPHAAGGAAFVNLGGDVVTWSAQATTNAPATLTQAQLAAIYNCTDTNWSQVGGKNAPLHAFIPQSGSGTRSFFRSHNMQQAQRVSRNCAFFLAAEDTPGYIVESGATEELSSSPRDPRTADYVNGRFG